MLSDDPDEAAARADLFRFLAACYYEPASAFVEERLFDSMMHAAGRIDPAWGAQAAQLGQAFEAADLQTLLVDYTRLFLGPVQPLARPYGSFWLSGEATLMQESTTAVLELYRQGGFDIDESFRDLPDHVAVELEFLYALGFRRAQSAREGNGRTSADLAALERRFLDEHLGRWVGRFTAAVEAGAQTDFYQRLAVLTHACAQHAVLAPPIH